MRCCGAPRKISGTQARCQILSLRLVIFSIFDFYPLVFVSDFETWPIIFITLLELKHLHPSPHRHKHFANFYYFFQHIRTTFWILRYLHWVSFNGPEAAGWPRLAQRRTAALGLGCCCLELSWLGPLKVEQSRFLWEPCHSPHPTAALWWQQAEWTLFLGGRPRVRCCSSSQILALVPIDLITLVSKKGMKREQGTGFHS